MVTASELRKVSEKNAKIEIPEVKKALSKIEAELKKAAKEGKCKLIANVSIMTPWRTTPTIFLRRAVKDELIALGFDYSEHHVGSDTMFIITW